MANQNQSSQPTGAANPSSPAPWILLVDDEPAMRQLIQAVLETQHWLVRVAEGATAAMTTLNAATTPPALLICYILMPGVDGLELTRRMLARLPRLKVILISGHLIDLSWWPTDLREICFLTKPFSNEQLIQAVGEALPDSGAAP
jgi:DNA-binding NtrC family response regulator